MQVFLCYIYAQIKQKHYISLLCRLRLIPRKPSRWMRIGRNLSDDVYSNKIVVSFVAIRSGMLGLRGIMAR